MQYFEVNKIFKSNLLNAFFSIFESLTLFISWKTFLKKFDYAALKLYILPRPVYTMLIHAMS